MVNSGFRGMGVESGAEYVLSAYVRAQPDGPRQLSARLTDDRGQRLAEGAARRVHGRMAAIRDDAAAVRDSRPRPARDCAGGQGEIDIDMVSLYPKETWKNRPNGLRKDLVQLLADMKPGFIRFPGGCIVEGRRLELRYDWKKTVGDVSERKALVNRWNDEFGHRPTPDYFQSFGLGFFEYFQLAEDVGASPLPIVNCGMACQFNSSETAALDDARSVRPGCARSDRIRQRPRRRPVGQAARADGASGAVQPEDDRHRQRAVGSAVHRALQAVRGRR